MCEACQPTASRRRFLGGLLGAASVLAPSTTSAQPVNRQVRGPFLVEGKAGSPGLQINPREAWGSSLPPKGLLEREESVRFLLVHHTAATNRYEQRAVPSKIREVYAYHTSRSKGWNDVCYNFFVDRFGGVWEGRAGSLAGPVRADATGGSQGFAQLVCLLGNFETEEPTTAMVESCSKVLGWLADKYAVDLDQRRPVAFVSRGSNRWPQGVKVNARPISGHRDMSATACPGRYVYELLEETIPRAAKAAKEEFARNGRSGSSPSTISPGTGRRP